jgi:hypothetical protein
MILVDIVIKFHRNFSQNRIFNVCIAEAGFATDYNFKANNL